MGSGVGKRETDVAEGRGRRSHQKQKHALGGRHVGQWTCSTCRSSYPTLSSSCGGAVVLFVFFLNPFLHPLILISSLILRSHLNPTTLHTPILYHNPQLHPRLPFPNRSCSFQINHQNAN